MLTVFDIDHSIGADDYDFKQLCPAFIQQAKSRACKQQSNQTKADPEKHMGKSKCACYRSCYGVYFTIALLNCVCYNEDFVNQGSLNRGSVPYITFYCNFGRAEENCS